MKLDSASVLGANQGAGEAVPPGRSCPSRAALAARPAPPPRARGSAEPGEGC